MTFVSPARATRKKVTRREKFLTEMEAVVPWRRKRPIKPPNPG